MEANASHPHYEATEWLKGLNQRLVPIFFAIAAGYWRGLRLDGTRSTEVPRLQQQLPKQGAAEFDVSHPRLHQGGLAVSHWLVMHLRIANIRLNCWLEKQRDSWEVAARKRIVAIIQLYQ